MNKKVFVLESLRIALFCVGVTLLGLCLGVDQHAAVMIFVLAAMTSTATFLPKPRPMSFVLTASSLMVLSIVGGGVCGFYFPTLAKVIGTIAAILIFYFPKRASTTSAAVITVVMFFSFSSLSFDWVHGLQYLGYGAGVVVLSCLLHRLLEGKIYTDSTIDLSDASLSSVRTASVVAMAFALGWVWYYLLYRYSTVEHLYWIAVTILVVIQGSQVSTIKRSMLRMLVNMVGAFCVLVLFEYAGRHLFWLDFGFVVLFLFAIFALGFSYVGRTFFIELFVLSMIHIMGEYHSALAYDRAILNLVGGCTVIFSTLVLTPLFNRLKSKPFSKPIN